MEQQRCCDIAQLTAFVSRGLRPLLLPKQYSSLMGQLEVVFWKHVYGNGASKEELRVM
jgi:hypothetical protein